MKGDTILMQRRFRTGYLDGFWALPSGFVCENENALTGASRELREETSLIVERATWRFVCVMHRRTDWPIIDLFFTTDRFSGEPRICEPTKCDGLAFFPFDALPAPLAGYIGVPIGILKGGHPTHGTYHDEGWTDV